jgi:5,10-methylene-tetrahydrofolate dehydrogenase/methenyl tetrahydrofolate cyclohydrolase
MANIIDGKAFAQDLREKITRRTTRLKKETGIQPGLATVLVGEDPASHVYVRNKNRQTKAVGMASFHHELDAQTSQTRRQLVEKPPLNLKYLRSDSLRPCRQGLNELNQQRVIQS